MRAKRREDYQTDPTLLAKDLSKFDLIWTKFWRWLYFLVGTTTYLGMLTSLGFTIYWTYWQYDLLKASMTGLMTILLIYVNKVNPKV